MSDLAGKGVGIYNLSNPKELSHDQWWRKMTITEESIMQNDFHNPKTTHCLSDIITYKLHII